MRIDSAEFAAQNAAPAKSMRLVVRLVFDVESIYATSDPNMVNVPGVPILGCIQNVSGVSQEIHPDEGRATIGSLSFSLVDLESQVSSELRDQLQTNMQDLRGRTVQLRFGYTADYNDTVPVMTQVVTSPEYQDGAYNVTCADIQRIMRKTIFDAKVTNLRLSVDDNDTTIPVQSTTNFQTVFHGPSYSDAPNQTVGYVRIDDEVIRYTGKTSITFTGCTRGVFNTIAAAHKVDPDAADERQPKVEEFIYLELPGPKMARAILTGELEGDAAFLPPHWCLEIDSALVA
jgi:hypothetical protein